MKKCKFRSTLFTSPTPENPYPYLKDFGKIESCGFGFWRPIAILVWILLVALFGSITWICADMIDLGMTIFYRIEFQLMTNMYAGHTDSVIIIPLVKPVGSIACLLCLASIVMLCRTLLRRTVSKTYTMSETGIA